MTNSETTLRTFDFAGLELRVIMDGDTPWFMAADVCEALGFSKHPTNRTYAHHLNRSNLSPLERRKRSLPTIRSGSQLRPQLILSESGLYKLIMRSDKSEARKFQDWVTREVLPAIRKTGGYLLNEEARDTARADDRQAMPLPEAFAYEASLSA